jgi:hypothetical protein
MPACQISGLLKKQEGERNAEDEFLQSTVRSMQKLSSIEMKGLPSLPSMYLSSAAGLAAIHRASYGGPSICSEPVSRCGGRRGALIKQRGIHSGRLKPAYSTETTIVYRDDCPRYDVSHPVWRRQLKRLITLSTFARYLWPCPVHNTAARTKKMSRKQRAVLSCYLIVLSWIA